MIFKGAFVHVHIVLAEIILIPRNIGVKKFSIKYHNNVSTGCYLFLNGFDDRCDVSGQPMILGNSKPHLAASNVGSISRTAAVQWCVFVAEVSRSLHRPPTCYAAVFLASEPILILNSNSEGALGEMKRCPGGRRDP